MTIRENCQAYLEKQKELKDAQSLAKSLKEELLEIGREFYKLEAPEVFTYSAGGGKAFEFTLDVDGDYKGVIGVCESPLF